MKRVSEFIGDVDLMRERPERAIGFKALSSEGVAVEEGR
jgi:hypothetical protein